MANGIRCDTFPQKPVARMLGMTIALRSPHEGLRGESRTAGVVTKTRIVAPNLAESKVHGLSISRVFLGGRPDLSTGPTSVIGEDCVDEAPFGGLGLEQGRKFIDGRQIPIGMAVVVQIGAPVYRFCPIPPSIGGDAGHAPFQTLLEVYDTVPVVDESLTGRAFASVANLPGRTAAATGTTSIRPAVHPVALG